MNYRVSYRNEIISDIINENIELLFEELKKRNLTEKSVILCKADSHLSIIIQWQACLKIGALPIIVPFDYTFDKIKSSINGINIKLMIETTKMNQHLINETHNLEKNVFLENVSIGSVMHLTSATTGDPKLVLRTKKQLDCEIQRNINYFNINKEDAILPIVPFHHSWGFVCAMLVSLKVGCKLVIPEVIMPRNIIDLCNSNNVSILLGVPIFYKKMINVSENYKLNEDIRYIISSGGPMEDGLQHLFKERFGADLLQEYGCTETGCLAISEPNDKYNVVGRPFDEVTFEIRLDEDKKPWIYVFSPGTAGTYITKDGIKNLDNDFIRIKDVGSVSKDGKLKIFGRADDVLVIAGKKIPKQNVSEVIKKVNGIKDAKIYMKSNELFNELACEYTSHEEINRDSIISHCRNFLPEYQIPKHYFKVDNISSVVKTTWKQNY